MADYMQKYADKEVEKLGRKIGRTYRQAAKEIDEKLESFWKTHDVISKKMLQDVKDGVITKKDYEDWLRNQVFRGERWQSKLDQITKTYIEADEKARKMVGNADRDIFVNAANWQARDTAKAINGAVSFDMYDRRTVDRLLKDDPKMLPEWKIDQKKDYIWNEKRVRNAVNQGIIQGESVYDIGKRLTNELSASNASKMDMFARTAVTGAQNAGRIERLHEAEEMGIKVRKKWLSAHDARVRDAHADLDGVEVDVDEPFHNDLGDIMYPGDPSADPANVYNCRCTLIYVYPKYDNNKTKEKEYSYKTDESFSASLGEKLSPYPYQNYDDYKTQMEQYTGEKTKWIEDVHPGTVIDMQSESSFNGEPHCDFSRVDNAVARCYEKVQLQEDYNNLVICDYDMAKYHLPDGENDRRLTTDAVAQVFENQGQTVIAVRREWMNGTLQDSLTERRRMIDNGEILQNVFPIESPETVIMHEWGHTVHNHFLNAMCYDDEDAKALWYWFRTLEKEEIISGLSKYASVNFGEFCAECYAEMQADNPRSIARKYWSFMEKILKKGGKYD